MNDIPSRRRFLQTVAGAGVVGLAGCLDSVTGGDAPEPGGKPVVGASTTNGDDGPFFSHDVELSREYTDFAENAVSGGVPKDGIPSIDDPAFEDASDADERLDPDDPVFGVELGGQARAYPQYILVRHEIVNDELAGYNIAVTYCPLTGTAMGFDRGDDEFGVSGMLVNSNLIMYDRVSESWWPQVLGTLVRGENDAFLGRSLREFRVTWTTWERWRTVHEDTEVLTEDTGEPVSYNRDPYGTYNPRGGYYKNQNLLFSPLREDDRHHPKTVFIGARTGDGKVAFSKDRLREESLLETDVGGVPYLAAYHDALDSAWVYRNPEDRTIVAAEEWYEDSTGEQYTADSLPLEAVNAFDAMWFAWAGFYPETEVVA
ncbi:MAG: DUF3179 domain-containing (seleno)protein [Haloarculaceae archaeon]